MIIPHRPVLVEEVIDGLAIRPDGIYVDGTAGTGGHAEGILNLLGEKGRFVGVDCDSEALKIAGRRLKRYEDRATLVLGRYEKLGEILDRLGTRQVDGLLLDLGLSSLQLSDSVRGFSFSEEGPLDMRMDSAQSLTASEILKKESDIKLAEIFRDFGEERFAKRIARAIVEERERKPLRTTRELAALVERVIPRRAWPRRIHPATRIFQALRIAVNREIERLQSLLESFVGLLAPRGRVAIISYHSLEDRLVKRKFRSESELGRLKLITKKPICASDLEIGQNPRARSAKLRVAEKI